MNASATQEMKIGCVTTAFIVFALGSLPSAGVSIALIVASSFLHRPGALLHL